MNIQAFIFNDDKTKKLQDFLRVYTKCKTQKKHKRDWMLKKFLLS